LISKVLLTFTKELTMNRFDNHNEEFSKEDFMRLSIEDVHDDEDEYLPPEQWNNDHERKHPRKKTESIDQWYKRLISYEVAENGCSSEEELIEKRRKHYDEIYREVQKNNSPPPPPPQPVPTEPGFFGEFFGRCKDILTLKFLSEGAPMDPGTNPLNLALGNRRTCPRCTMQIPRMARTCPFCKSVS
jgi:hypothetical protein